MRSISSLIYYAVCKPVVCGGFTMMILNLDASVVIVMLFCLVLLCCLLVFLRLAGGLVGEGVKSF